MIKRSLVVGLLFSVIATGPGVAAPGVDMQSLDSAQKKIVELGPTLAPFQHVRFCQHYPADCQPNSQANDRIELNSKTVGLLRYINHQVNTVIVPVEKIYDSHIEVSWTVAPNGGDCNDYAVTKQHELLHRGLPSSALRLAVVKTDDGDGHLVLVVGTTNGDLVLDNLTEEIRSWNEANYRWLKIQSRNDPNYWVDVKSPIVVSAALKDAFRKMALEAKR
jgi:predicted transglutaminase-like cysteine proteinase